MDIMETIMQNVPEPCWMAGFAKAFGVQDGFRVSDAIAEHLITEIADEIVYCDQFITEWEFAITRVLRDANEMFDLQLDFHENEPLPF